MCRAKIPLAKFAPFIATGRWPLAILLFIYKVAVFDVLNPLSINKGILVSEVSLLVIASVISSVVSPAAEVKPPDTAIEISPLEALIDESINRSAEAVPVPIVNVSIKRGNSTVSGVPSVGLMLKVAYP